MKLKVLSCSSSYTVFRQLENRAQVLHDRNSLCLITSVHEADNSQYLTRFDSNQVLQW